MKVESVKFGRVVSILAAVAELSLILQRHACALIKGGKILSISENKFGKSTKHSEMIVIENFLSNRKTKLNKCILIVIRINNKGEIRSSKPCDECIKYIKKYGIKKIIYSNDSGFQEEGIDNIKNNHRTYYYRKAVDEKII